MFILVYKNGILVCKHIDQQRYAAPGTAMKIRITITVEKGLLDWLDEKVKVRTFANRSHGFEYLINHRRETEQAEQRIKERIKKERLLTMEDKPNDVTEDYWNFLMEVIGQKYKSIVIMELSNGTANESIWQPEIVDV